MRKNFDGQISANLCRELKVSDGAAATLRGDARDGYNVTVSANACNVIKAEGYADSEGHCTNVIYATFVLTSFTSYEARSRSKRKEKKLSSIVDEKEKVINNILPLSFPNIIFILH